MCRPDDIGDDEIIFRRIPENSCWFDPSINEVKPEAFKPRVSDVSGISVDRAKSAAFPEFRSAQQAAVGQVGKKYFVAALKVGDLRRAGLDIVPKPEVHNPGHAEIANLTYENRKSDASQEFMILLAHQLVLHVEGPFPILS